MLDVSNETTDMRILFPIYVKNRISYLSNDDVTAYVTCFKLKITSIPYSPSWLTL
jgi:hypothetical protein